MWYSRGAPSQEKLYMWQIGEPRSPTYPDEAPKLNGNEQGTLLAEQMINEDERFWSGDLEPEDAVEEGLPHKVD